MLRKPEVMEEQESNSNDLLSRAMRSLPDPKVGTELNHRIHAAIQSGVPKRQNLLAALRAGGAGLCGSFAITLVTLSLFTGSPRNNIVTDSVKLNTAATDHSGRTDNTDSVIERTDLTSASIRFLLIPEAARDAGSTPAKNNKHSMPTVTTVHKQQGA